MQPHVQMVNGVKAVVEVHEVVKLTGKVSRKVEFGGFIGVMVLKIAGSDHGD
jgi:hypothetical protein